MAVLPLSRAGLRLALLLVVAVGVVGLSRPALLVFAGLLLLWLLTVQRAVLGEVVQRVLRLRWFLLAIFVLYLFGQPGQTVLQGLPEALYRVGILVVLVTNVSLCLHRLPPQELGSALTAALAPLGRLGLPSAAFSRRLAGTLDAVGKMDQRLRALRAAEARPGLASVAGVFVDAESHRLEAQDAAVTGPVASGREWLLLLLVLAILLLLRLL